LAAFDYEGEDDDEDGESGGRARKVGKKGAEYRLEESGGEAV
jgi:hypothetical protein